MISMGIIMKKFFALALGTILLMAPVFASSTHMEQQHAPRIHVVKRVKVSIILEKKPSFVQLITFLRTVNDATRFEIRSSLQPYLVDDVIALVQQFYRLDNAIIAGLCPNHPFGLTDIVQFGNYINDNNISALALLFPEGLLRLHLWRTSIGVRGMTALSLNMPDSIRELALTCNNLDDVKLKALTTSPLPSQLRRIYFTRNSITDQGVIDLLPQLDPLSHLTLFKITENYTADRSKKALEEAGFKEGSEQGVWKPPLKKKAKKPA